MTASLLAFIPVALLLAMIPGADTALVTRNALALGLREARWTILGICTGCVLHATASALGLSAILATSARAYDAVKLAGAAYLIWIGVQSIRGASGPTTPTTDVKFTRGAHPFMQGFLTNVLNPKVALFYLTFLPQFIPAGAPVLRTSLLLAMVHNVLGFAWLSLYARFVDRLRGALTRPMVKAWLERVTGGALVLLGARLAWSRR
ncbi:MAG TPA: LysE family translocator [Gemmatimonadaceae bacterium]|nr:LysE family translocator [Gemmatimonadaceae bacterium]